MYSASLAAESCARGEQLLPAREVTHTSSCRNPRYIRNADRQLVKADRGRLELGVSSGPIIIIIISFIFTSKTHRN